MDSHLKAQITAANTHYREGHLDDAEKLYTSLHQYLPEHAGVLTRLGEIALWKNEVGMAEVHFKAALRYTSWLGKLWPFNVQLHHNIALTYYRQDRFTEAAYHFNKAAGWFSFGPFKSLKAFAQQFTLFESHTPYQIEGAATVTLPFVMTDPLPVIQVSINSGQPIYMFIDTGGGEVILDSEFAAQAGVAYAGNVAGEGGGTKGSIGLGKLDKLTLGDMMIGNLPVQLMDTQPFAAIFDGLPIKGVIGTCLLMHFLATIDYANGCLILRPKDAVLPATFQSAKAFPFWLVQTHYMVTQGNLNGKVPTLFFVDTGLAGKGFSAVDTALQKAGIVPNWSKAEKGIAAFGETESVDITAEQVSLGSDENEVIRQNLPGIAFKTPFPVLGYGLGLWIGGLISHEFFRPYALTLDFERMKLILHKVLEISEQKV